MSNQQERIQDFLNSENSECGTWRNWIKEVLLTLEKEDECFSGKRPLGNSDWWHELSESLIVVAPKIGSPSYDSDGFLLEFDPDLTRVSTAWKAVLDEIF